MLDVITRFAETVLNKILEVADLEIVVAIILACFISNAIITAISNNKLFKDRSIIGMAVRSMLRIVSVGKLTVAMPHIMSQAYFSLSLMSGGNMDAQTFGTSVVKAMFHTAIAVAIYDMWIEFAVPIHDWAMAYMKAKIKSLMEGAKPDGNP